MRPPIAADMISSSPGINRKANARLPPVHATMILQIVLVESAARMGEIASAGRIFPDATSEAIETAAECVSAKPANAAPTIAPISANWRANGRHMPLLVLTACASSGPRLG